MIYAVPSLHITPLAPVAETWVIPIFYPAVVGTMIEIMLGILLIMIIYWVIKFVVTTVIGG